MYPRLHNQSQGQGLLHISYPWWLQLTWKHPDSSTISLTPYYLAASRVGHQTDYQVHNPFTDPRWSNLLPWVGRWHWERQYYHQYQLTNWDHCSPLQTGSSALRDCHCHQGGPSILLIEPHECHAASPLENIQNSLLYFCVLVFCNSHLYQHQLLPASFYQSNIFGLFIPSYPNPNSNKSCWGTVSS